MNISDIGEFGLIQEIRKGIILPSDIVGIGDDCAIIPQREGIETLVSTDMLIEGTHFLMNAITPYDLGWKSAAANISDIAAMGGECVGSFLSFALPETIDKEWLDAFFRGYNDLSGRFNCPLLGGDTTYSHIGLCINVTVIGKSTLGRSVRRSNACDGDLICVTGELGDSAGGLKVILENCVRDKTAEYLVDRHYKPLPRINEGQHIARAGANAMMDISDGIGSDLLHILHSSGAGAEIETESIPISLELLRKCAQTGWDPLELAISGGEDYELLFTISEKDAQNLDLAYYVIGRITSGKEIIWKGSDKNYSGYRHF